MDPDINPADNGGHGADSHAERRQKETAHMYRVVLAGQGMVHGQ